MASVRMSGGEQSGFKLLQEDSMEERPCAAVKKFVTSVLGERKDMKDTEVANSFRNVSTGWQRRCLVSYWLVG